MEVSHHVQGISTRILRQRPPVDASAPGFGEITVEVGVWVSAE